MVQQERDGQRKGEYSGLANRESEKTFQEMIVAIGDSLSDIVRSDHAEDGEEEDDVQAEQGQMSQDDKPCRVMVTSSNTVLPQRERFWRTQMTLDTVSQMGSEHTVYDSYEQDK